MRRMASIVALALVHLAGAPAYAAPTDLCESAIEAAAAKFLQCRLNAESRYTRDLDRTAYRGAIARCADRFARTLSSARARHGVANCSPVPDDGFRDYLGQCSDALEAAAKVGGAVPLCDVELQSCSTSLDECEAERSTASSGLKDCSTRESACLSLVEAAEAGTATAADVAAGRTFTSRAGIAITGTAETFTTTIGNGLLRTGQSSFYGPGSDGDVQAGTGASFVDNGDGTITDKRTGLMWEKKSDDGSVHDQDNVYGWSNGWDPHWMNGTLKTVFLDSLNAEPCFAGHCDWRIPNAVELESVRNLERVYPSTYGVFRARCAPGCSVSTCSCTRAAPYWTSTTSVRFPDGAWYVGFDFGQLYGDFKWIEYHGRAVRGGG